MTEFSEFVLENSVDRGWRTFEHWLARVLTGMIDGDVLVVARESGDGEPGRDKQPHVQFCAWGDDLLRAEAASNRHLDRRFALTERQYEGMLALGYDAPLPPAEALANGGSTNFNIDVPRKQAAEIARRSVLTLREIYGVLHPAFLSFSGDIHAEFDDEDEVIELHPTPPSSVPQNPPGMPPSGTLAKDWSLVEAGPIAMPESPEHLRVLIEEALIPVLGRRPLVDEDGDFVVPVAGTLVFVRVVESAPVVAVFSQLVRSSEAGRESVEREVAELNADIEMVKFFAVADRIVAGCTLPANPFVGAHLRELLSLVGRVASAPLESSEPVELAVPAVGRTNRRV